MISLYIDTSSSFLYSGIVKDDCLVAQIKQSFKKDMSTFALSEITKMFKKNGLKPNDIDKIIVCNGPGSFTGIRIGVTIAKTYAWSLNKEITTITSLEAMAEYYSANLSQNIKRGKRESMLKNLWNGGKVPYGYKVENQSDSQL